MTISLPPKGSDAKVLGAYFSPLKVEALATPTMQVKVAEGAFWTADNEHQEFIGGTSPLLSAPGADAKWVLLTVTPNGTLNLVDGTAGTTPELPDVALYKDELPLAAIFVGDTVTAITNDMIYDIRPMWQIPPDSVSQTQLNDFATITYVNNGLATKAETDGTGDANFTLNVGGGSINDSGIYIDRQAGPDVAIRFNELAVSGSPAVSSPQWEFTNDGATWNAIGVSSGNYYLKTELNAGALDFLYYQQNQLTGAAGTGVLDLRYYEQADADALFSVLGHTHLKAEITDLAAQVETVNLIAPVGGNVSISANDILDIYNVGPAGSHALVWNTTNLRYENRFLNTDDLSDTDTSTVAPVAGDVMIHTGAIFTNRALLKADISNLVESDYVLVAGTNQDVFGVKTFKDGVVIETSLTVNGANTTIDSTTLTVSDPHVDINFGETGDGVGDGTGTAGLRVDRGFTGSPAVANQPAILQWDENAQQWEIGIGTNVAGILTSVHTHVLNDIIDVNATAAEVNFLQSATSNIQLQLNDKISRTGDVMDAAVNLTFSAGGEVLGLPASPSATGAASKEYVDTLNTTHVSDMTVHLTADQNTFLDGLALAGSPLLTSADVNNLSGISGNVQELLDGKTPVLAGAPAANNNLTSWDATGKILLDSGVRVDDGLGPATNILWTSNQIDTAKADKVVGTVNNFITLDGSSELQDSGLILNNAGTGTSDLWSASQIDSAKADKLIPAANNNLAALSNATGNLVDSGVLVNDGGTTTADIWTAAQINTAKPNKVAGTVDNFATLDGTGELQDSGLILNDAGVAATDLWSADKIDTTKMDKAGGSPAVAGNFAEFDGTGNVVDGGASASSFAAPVHTHVAADVTDFATAADARIAAASIDDLADVGITGVATDHLLQWNGAAWVNVTVVNAVGSDFVLKTGDTISGDLLISGDLTVSGTTTSIDSVNLEVADKNITLNAGYSGPTSGSTDSGLHVNRNDSGGSPPVLDLATLLWNDATERWEAGLEGSEKVIAVEGLTVAQPLYEMQQAAEGSPLGSPTTTIAVFTLGFGVPTPAAGATGIQVFVNGVKQIEGAGKAYTVDYTNPSSTVVTFNAGQEPTVAADVEFYGFGYIV